MAEMNYLNFDLLIDRSGKKYRARVISSPTGEPAAEFSLPFSDEELANLLTILRQQEPPEAAEEAAKDFGTRLFTAVFSGTRGKLFLRSSPSTVLPVVAITARIMSTE